MSGSTMGRRPKRTLVVINYGLELSLQAFVILQGIVLVPLYLHYISLPVYGAWVASSQIVGWATLFYPGTDRVLRQRVSHALGANEPERIGRLLGSGAAINIAFCVALILAEIPLAIYAPGWLRMRGAEQIVLRRALYLTVLGSGLSILGHVVGASLVALQKVEQSGAASICGTVLGIAVNVILLLHGLGVESIAWGGLVRVVTWTGMGAFFLLATLRKHREIRVQLDYGETRQLLKLSTVNLAANAATWLQTGMDATLAGVFLGPSASAKLTLTGRPYDVSGLLAARVGAATQPSVATLAGERQTRRIREATVAILGGAAIIVSCTIGATIALNRELIRLWVGRAAFGGDLLSGLMGWAVACSTMIETLISILFGLGEINYTAKVSLWRAAAKGGLTLIGIQWIGLIAAPIATIIAAVVPAGPMLWRRLIEITGMDRQEKRRALVLMFFVPVAGLAAGTLASTLISVHGWLWVFVTGAGIGVALALISLLLAASQSPALIRRLLELRKRPATACPQSNG
jgi:O-antigen/teichoic acid export membrane protein